jgi:hypothetical protein
MRAQWNLGTLSDADLLRRLSDLVGDSRRVEADLVAHIGEVDARRLYSRETVPSMFEYCVRILHLSEQEAYLRITVARASRPYPALLTLLRDGRLHLSGIARLAPHLTPGNAEALLRRAVHKSKRQIEELVAELAPRPDAPTIVRRLPERREDTSPGGRTQLGPDRVESLALKRDRGNDSGNDRDEKRGLVGQHEERLETVSSGAQKSALVTTGTGVPAPVPGGARSAGSAARSDAVIQPLSPARYKVQFTASAGFRDKLERLQALMRSSVPDGDLAAILEQAVTEKLQRLEARRFARTAAPRKQSGPWRARPGRHGTSRPRCGGPCASATRGGAATWTSRAGVARRVGGSSSTTATPTASFRNTA